jgi:hypothetical protein
MRIDCLVPPIHQIDTPLSLIVIVWQRPMRIVINVPSPSTQK